MSNHPPDPVFVFRGATTPVMSVTFLKGVDGNSQYIAAGTQEGMLLIWDLKTKCLDKKWMAHPGSSILWMYSQSAGELWTLGRHDKVTRWNIKEEPAILQCYSFYDYLGFSHCDILENTVLLGIPGPSQEDVSVYDTDEQIKICSLTPRDAKKSGSVMQLRWIALSSKARLLVAYENGNVSLWDYETCSVISDVECGETPICFTINLISQAGLIGTASEKLYVFQISLEEKMAIDKEMCITNPGSACCVVRPDGKIYVTGGWDYRIRLFSSKKMKPLAVLNYHKETVSCLAYSSSFIKHFDCQNLLAAGSSDMSVSVWKLFE